jgi:hypothetical protein
MTTRLLDVPPGLLAGRKLMFALGALVSLSACNRNAEAPQESAAAAQQSSRSAPAPEDPFPTMARAVYLTKAEQPVDLRFELVSAPQAKKNFQLKLNLQGLLDASALQLQVSSVESLEIVAGAQTSHESLKQGESWSPVVELRSSSNGLFVLEVTLQATTTTGDLAYKYSIPVAITVPEPSSSSSAAASSKS